MYFCNRSITSDAAASDRPARRRSCGMWSSSSARRNSGARSSSTESVTMRRTVESRRKAAITMFASTTSRRGAASDSRPRRASRGLEPTPESFLDETVERPDVLERKHAPTGQGIHPLQVADSFGQKPSDDLAPLDFGTGLHLAMQLRGDGHRDIGHRLDYVRAHNQTFGGMDELGGREAPPSGRSVDIHDKSLHCHMKNLQVRVDEDEIEDLDELAQEMRLSRSEIARSALREGVRRLRTEKALARYLNLEFTLSRAAQYAGVPIRGDRKRWTSLGLGIGEASLFETSKGDRLILDEIPARTVAEAEGREYTGLLGLLLAGVEARAIPASRAREILEKLARSSFRMSADLYGEVLRRLGDRA